MIDIVMDEVIPDKSSEEQEAEITEDVREISKTRKRPTRNKNKVGRKPVKNKGKAAVRSPEKLGQIFIHKNYNTLILL
jgi:hypothetical protein